jgi:hypothetical protein
MKRQRPVKHTTLCLKPFILSNLGQCFSCSNAGPNTRSVGCAGLSVAEVAEQGHGLLIRVGRQGGTRSGSTGRSDKTVWEGRKVVDRR